MRRERGSLRQVAANMAAAGIPMRVRAQLALRNALRRLGPPPRDCCGHGGEPGC